MKLQGVDEEEESPGASRHSRVVLLDASAVRWLPRSTCFYGITLQRIRHLTLDIARYMYTKYIVREAGKQQPW